MADVHVNTESTSISRALSGRLIGEGTERFFLSTALYIIPEKVDIYISPELFTVNDITDSPLKSLLILMKLLPLSMDI